MYAAQNGHCKVVPKTEKKGSSRKVKEEKQTVLSTWVIAGTEAERLKLIRMQEQNLKRSKLESEIEDKFGNSAEERHPVSVYECVNTMSRGELSWNERAQRIYLYLHPELADKRMSIMRWAYPSLLENTFKNWLKRHDMISTWIPILKHLNGHDVKQNIENAEAKDRLISFFQEEFLSMLRGMCKGWSRIPR